MKNAIILSATLAIAALSGQAFADTSYDSFDAKNAKPVAASEKTREAVRAETLAAHKAGISTTVSETSEPTPSSSGSTLTREQVRQEAVSAARSHEAYQGRAN